MPRPSTQNLSDLVGHLFPTTQTGSYPRPGWFRLELGERDFRAAMRHADYAEQYLDATRAVIGDQLQVGLDVPPTGTWGGTRTRASTPRSCTTRRSTSTASRWTPRSTRSSWPTATG